MAGNPQIIVRQLAGSTGHVNVTFVDSSVNILGVFGANIAQGDNPLNGFDGGVYAISKNDRAIITQTAMPVTVDQFNNAYGYAVNMRNATEQGRADYDLIVRELRGFCRKRSGKNRAVQA